MIVNNTVDGWQIIFHRAHALLSMKIAMELKDEYWPLPEYWPEGLLAIAEHDDGRQDWNEKSYINEAGAPLDYRQSAKIDIVQAKRAITDARYTSTFMALMISLHAHSLYKDDTSKEAKKFLSEQSDLRDTIYQQLKIKRKDALQCYEMLRFCDETSLLICQNEIPPAGREIESTTLNGQAIKISKNEECFTTTPWVFIDNQMTLTYEYYAIKQLKFKDNSELKKAIDKENPSIREILFSKMA